MTEYERKWRIIVDEIVPHLCQLHISDVADIKSQICAIPLPNVYVRCVGPREYLPK